MTHCVYRPCSDHLLFFQALFIVLLLGWLFVPVYLTAGVSSFYTELTVSVLVS